MTAATVTSQKYSQWLQYGRARREIEYQLKLGINRLQSPFSYQRVKGLEQLLQFLRTLQFCDEKSLFLSVHSEPDYNLVRLAFQLILFPKQTKAVRTVKEQRLGIELVSGIVLLYPECKTEFMALDGMQLMLQMLASSEADDSVYSTILHLLLAVMTDSEANQAAFEHADGYGKVEHIIKQKKAKKELRAKCVEFLLFCIKFFRVEQELVHRFGDHRVKQLHKMMVTRKDEQFRDAVYAFLDSLDTGQ